MLLGAAGEEIGAGADMLPPAPPQAVSDAKIQADTICRIVRMPAALSTKRPAHPSREIFSAAQVLGNDCDRRHVTGYSTNAARRHPAP